MIVFFSIRTTNLDYSIELSNYSHIQGAVGKLTLIYHSQQFIFNIFPNKVSFKRHNIYTLTICESIPFG